MEGKAELRNYDSMNEKDSFLYAFELFYFPSPLNIGHKNRQPSPALDI
jgi:hypothetical protein